MRVTAAATVAAHRSGESSPQATIADCYARIRAHADPAIIEQNIAAILAEGDARPDHLVRLTWYVVDMDEYLANLKELGQIYREIFGAHYPAMALVQVVRLVEKKARVEIEATAVVPR